MSNQAYPVFNIQASDKLTFNVTPLMHEIRHALQALIEQQQTGIIDLRSIPLAPGEEQTIINLLGCGEVRAQLNALGPSEIIETRFSGVWLITHYNEENDIISRTIEITRMPEILESQPIDMQAGLKQLEEELDEPRQPDTTNNQQGQSL